MGRPEMLDPSQPAAQSVPTDEDARAVLMMMCPSLVLIRNTLDAGESRGLRPSVDALDRGELLVGETDAT
jgi:hypothetical protein